MQNRYFGDTGDFSKYGILHSAAQYMKRIGILWCLTDDENHNNDGKHIAYLNTDKGHPFRACDPELYDSLKTLLIDADGKIITKNRRVALMSSLQILPNRTAFFEEMIPTHHDSKCRKNEREDWFQRARQTLQDCDLVFCDPDNGIEVASVSKRAKKQFKYIYWDELKTLWTDKKSLIIYQHMQRDKLHLTQVHERCCQLVERLGTDVVLPLTCPRGTVRTYFLIPQPRHNKCFAKIYKEMTGKRWSHHIKPWCHDKEPC